MNKEELMEYYKVYVLKEIDPSLYKLEYNCFACYYRNYLEEFESTECIFGEHKYKKYKWMSCHLLPIYNPNGELLKLYNILNNNADLFVKIYKNKKVRMNLIEDFYFYIQDE
jgi:hypothetical protein